MNRSTEQLRRDALAIWQAGVDAVRSDRLVREHVRVDGNQLHIADHVFSLDQFQRIVVVGAGKAGAGMAAGLEDALGDVVSRQKNITGWINVPADCVRPLRHIHLHAARPAGENEPTAAGVAGTAEILRLVRSLTENDLCICLISGGGSALLPAPVDGVTLADKQAITRHLSGAGANIAELNTVRKQLSKIKGGGLARACRAPLVSLIISDVLGDPLDLIASGPTVADPATPTDALSVLDRFKARDVGISDRVFDTLRKAESRTNVLENVTNVIIGNNAAAVDAAGMRAERLGYSHAMTAATKLEGAAEDIGRHLAEMAVRMRDQNGPDCLIYGGEPVVNLIDEKERGLGGRNQQLVLAALSHLPSAEGIALLSGGTDGEDGPTDAAGAVLDATVVEAARAQQLDPLDYLRRNDAYRFFDAVGGLIKTGPTHTNVCDVRVVVVG